MTKFSGAFTLQAQMQNVAAGTWARAPGAPTIGTASVVSGTSASVTFTPPTDLGIGAVTYIATSNPGGIVGTSSSSPVTVNGLTTGSSYTFTVTASTPGGSGPASAASNSITMVVQGQQEYTTPGTYTWVAPAGVTSVSAVVVGGGGNGATGGCCCGSPFGGAGGGGGALAYINNYSVTPGDSYTLRVGARNATNGSYFQATTTVSARGSDGNVPGSVQAGTGFSGAFGGFQSSFSGGGGGGGAGGYSGAGGQGGYGNGNAPVAGSGGAGGGGGQCASGSVKSGAGGGGVGLLGQGSNGTAPAVNTLTGGGGGSGGCNGGNGSATTKNGGAGGLYGAGGGGAGFQSGSSGTGGNGGTGAVRIIWPGNTRSFPSTNTGNL